MLWTITQLIVMISSRDCRHDHKQTAGIFGVFWCCKLYNVFLTFARVTRLTAHVNVSSERAVAAVANHSGVTRGVTPSRGVTPEGKKTFLRANLQRIVEKRGRTGKKGVG